MWKQKYRHRSQGVRRVVPGFNDLERERDRFARINLERHHLLPKAVLLGFMTGLVAAAFHYALYKGEALRNSLIGFAHQYGLKGIALPMLFSLAMVSISTWLVRRFAPEAAGSGVPHIKAVLQGYRTLSWPRVLCIKFLSGVVGISGGLVVGPEGPSAHMGSAIGKSFGSGSMKKLEEDRVLIAAGGGAGLAAAFNAPLTGLVFVIEELQGKLASLEFFTAAVACLMSDLIFRLLFGQLPVFHVTVAHIPSLADLPIFGLLGVVAGLCGVVFNKWILVLSGLSSPSQPRSIVAWCTIWGVVIGVFGWYMPTLVGVGYGFVEEVLTSEVQGLKLIPLYFVFRFFLTVGSASTGVAGGIFIPLLGLGALIGLEIGLITKDWLPFITVDPQVFAVIGMAALFAGIVRTPLTAVVLIIEITSNYALILPLLAASFAALIVADLCRDAPINEALLERDLRARAIAPRP